MSEENVDLVQSPQEPRDAFSARTGGSGTPHLNGIRGDRAEKAWQPGRGGR
jgi:hypothetical protein